MTPFQEGNSMFYNVTLKNDKDEINATIDYYNNGKTKEIANILPHIFQKRKAFFYHHISNSIKIYKKKAVVYEY